MSTTTSDTDTVLRRLRIAVQRLEQATDSASDAVHELCDRVDVGEIGADDRRSYRAVVDAVRRLHNDDHSGAQRFCMWHACRLAWEASQ